MWRRSASRSSEPIGRCRKLHRRSGHRLRTGRRSLGSAGVAIGLQQARGVCGLRRGRTGRQRTRRSACSASFNDAKRQTVPAPCHSANTIAEWSADTERARRPGEQKQWQLRPCGAARLLRAWSARGPCACPKAIRARPDSWKMITGNPSMCCAPVISRRDASTIIATVTSSGNDASRARRWRMLPDSGARPC